VSYLLFLEEPLRDQKQFLANGGKKWKWKETNQFKRRLTNIERLELVGK
jgi:hypothetical protein